MLGQAAVPVEARKQSRATLPLSQAADHHHHPQVAGALGSVLAQEIVREAETVVVQVAAREVVQAVETEEARV